MGQRRHGGTAHKKGGAAHPAFYLHIFSQAQYCVAPFYCAGVGAPAAFGRLTLSPGYKRIGLDNCGFAAIIASTAIPRLIAILERLSPSVTMTCSGAMTAAAGAFVATAGDGADCVVGAGAGATTAAGAAVGGVAAVLELA